MLPVYLAAFTFGVVLIGAGLLTGADKDAGGADGDGGLDHDAGADHDAHVATDKDLALSKDLAKDAATAAQFNPFLSLRFWTFFLGSFGMVGAPLAFFGLPLLVHLPVASLAGLGIGYATAWSLNRLKRDTVTGETDPRRIAGEEAEVVLSVGPGKRGKVRLTFAGQDLELFARTQEELTIERGQKVLIVAVREGEAEITPMRPKSLLPDTQQENA